MLNCFTMFGKHAEFLPHVKKHAETCYIFSAGFVFFFNGVEYNKDMRPTTMVRSFLQAIADHFQYFFYFYASNVYYYGCLPLPLLYKPSG